MEHKRIALSGVGEHGLGALGGLGGVGERMMGVQESELAEPHCWAGGGGGGGGGLHDDAADPQYIETVPGVGYRYIAPVETEP
jgi:hypothetical protein